MTSAKAKSKIENAHLEGFRLWDGLLVNLYAHGSLLTLVYASAMSF